jgi:hypothetical protein
VDDFKITKLEWAGLSIRIEAERIPRKVLNTKFNSKTTVGKPRTRWEE